MHEFLQDLNTFAGLIAVCTTGLMTYVMLRMKSMLIEAKLDWTLLLENRHKEWLIIVEKERVTREGNEDRMIERINGTYIRRLEFDLVCKAQDVHHNEMLARLNRYHDRLKDVEAERGIRRVKEIE